MQAVQPERRILRVRAKRGDKLQAAIRAGAGDERVLGQTARDAEGSRGLPSEGQTRSPHASQRKHPLRRRGRAVRQSDSPAAWFVVGSLHVVGQVRRRGRVIVLQEAAVAYQRAQDGQRRAGEQVGLPVVLGADAALLRRVGASARHLAVGRAQAHHAHHAHPGGHRPSLGRHVVFRSSGLKKPDIN